MQRILGLGASLAIVLLTARCSMDTGDQPAKAAQPAPTPSARAASAEQTLPPVSPETLARIDADFAYVPAGTLPPRYVNHVKQPEMKVGGFWMGKHEVTQEEWVSVMGRNPSAQKGDPRLPVTNVSWADVVRFVERLNQAAGSVVFRLPTGPEWELACRAGTMERLPILPSEAALSQYAWWGKNSDERSHPVGQLKPNTLGLYDMLGNVAEWCDTTQVASTGNVLRVDAGGNFEDANLSGHSCDYTAAWLSDEAREMWTGFRLAKTAAAPPSKVRKR